MEKIGTKLVAALLAAAFGIIAGQNPVLASTTSTTTMTHASHEANSASCNRPTQTVNRMANAQTLTPTEILPLPGGGQDYVYYIQGNKTEYLVPPVGFNPLNATDAQLKEYGFQPRPTGDLFQQKLWEQEMSYWRRTPAPQVLTIPGIDHRVQKLQTESPWATTYSGNWSGYYDKTTSNTFVGVEGDFVQPTPAAVTCSGADESTWVGIGGMNNSGLIQAGTDMNTDSTSTPLAWYEWVSPNNGGVQEQPMSQINVHVGDHIHVYVSYQTSTGQANFYIADNTNGTSQSVISNVNSSFYDGRSVEWVDEAPTSNGSIMPLMDYQQNPWTNAQSYNTSGVWNSVTAYPYDSLDMKDAYGTIESAASTLTTSTSWTDYWHNCN